MRSWEGFEVAAYTEYRPGTVEALPRLKRKRKNPGSRRKVDYKDTLAALDIEVTRLTGEAGEMFDTPDQERAIVYSWAFHVHALRRTYIGRTLESLGRFITLISHELEEQSLVVWVHNLSYEFQFLRGVHTFRNEEVFCIDARKILKAQWGQVEFRCSYLHSNMSLAQFTGKYGAQHRKLSGHDFDYDKIRYPWTPLTRFEWTYQLHDVWGLCEALEIELAADGDDLYSVPLTSTGYVRRDVRRAMQPHRRHLLPEIQPNEAVYKLLRAAFRGGNTHANRYYAGTVLEDVRSADRSSSYPDVQCNRPYPVGPWIHMTAPTHQQMSFMLDRRKKAAVMRVRFHMIELYDIYEGFPYIPRDKCTICNKGVYDNGRILSARTIELALTDVDLGIVKRQYKWEHMTVLEAAFSRYGPLPDEYTAQAKEYYRRKTELKNVPGADIFYMKSKNKLNSIYGMSAQDPCKQTIDYDGGQYNERTTPLEDLLAEANAKAFQSYAWGVWTTAWARYELQAGLDIAGRSAVYCDTDSVKYLGRADFTAYNNERMEASTKSGACAGDPSGEVHYMGVFENDGSYARFATLGSKKYAFQYSPGGPTHITIAGVTKSAGGAELDRGDEYGRGLERFVDTEHPFTFYEAGGTEARYHDDTLYSVMLDGHMVDLGPCTVIRPSTYTLGITGEYKELLKDPLDIWGSEDYNKTTGQKPWK